MKKVWVAVAVLEAWASVGFGGIGINWTAGGRVYGADCKEGVAAHTHVIWQLVYAGPNGVADNLDFTAPGWVGGDDVVLAERWIPEGGGVASDGTEWTAFLAKVGGDSVYEDLQWISEGYVFQRIYQGDPYYEVVLFESRLHALQTSYSGAPGFPDVFGAADGVNGGVVCTTWYVETLDMTVPALEPAAVAMDAANVAERRRCPENGSATTDHERVHCDSGKDATLHESPRDGR